MPERNGPYRGFPPARPPRQIDDHDSISVGGASYYAGKSGRAKVKLPEVTELSRRKGRISVDMRFPPSQL